jgi:hypothetical protein
MELKNDNDWTNVQTRLFFFLFFLSSLLAILLLFSIHQHINKQEKTTNERKEDMRVKNFFFSYFLLTLSHSITTVYIRELKKKWYTQSKSWAVLRNVLLLAVVSYLQSKTHVIEILFLFVWFMLQTLLVRNVLRMYLSCRDGFRCSWWQFQSSFHLAAALFRHK